MVPFKVQSNVTQGDPLSPTIFNMVLDVVLRHWVSVVEAIEEAEDTVTEGFVWYIQRLVAYFYENYVLLT